MNAKTRRKLEMGSRALEFSRAHLDESSGYHAAVAQLEEQLQRSKELAARQLEGFVEVRAASARKLELTRSMRRQQLAPYLPFKTMTGTMVAEAQRQKDLLVKHGLVERVLDSLTASLQEFDAVTEQGAAGRRVHIGASAELDVVADEVVQIVKVIDGLNRFRFAQDPELLAAWKSASNVTDSPRQPEKTPPSGDQAKPAA